MREEKKREKELLRKLITEKDGLRVLHMNARGILINTGSTPK